MSKHRTMVKVVKSERVACFTHRTLVGGRRIPMLGTKIVKKDEFDEMYITQEMVDYLVEHKELTIEDETYTVWSSSEKFNEDGEFERSFILQSKYKPATITIDLETLVGVNQHFSTHYERREAELMMEIRKLKLEADVPGWKAKENPCASMFEKRRFSDRRVTITCLFAAVAISIFASLVVASFL